MIVRTLQEADKTGRRVTSKTWQSTRLVLRADGAGFSFHITTILAGSATQMHYRNHIEAVYCISGAGEVEVVADGTVHPIFPGTMYLLEKHDEHILRARTELQLACVFNPPLNGYEVHDERGGYSLDGAPYLDK